MSEESKYCSDVMKKYFNKEFVMAKKDNKDFGNSTKCWICENDYIDYNVKAKGHCYMTGKYRGSAHRDPNTNVKLNEKNLLVFHSRKNYDSHPIMQELGKFNLKISIISNGMEKYMIFSINS